MKIIKRGLGILLMVSFLSCQILPEWCMAIASFAYAAEAETTESSTVTDETAQTGESESAEESSEAVGATGESSEENPVGETEETVTGGQSETTENGQTQASETPELDRLMEERRNPNSTGFGSGSNGGSSGGSAITAKAPEKEIAEDEQKDSVGEIIAKKTGTQVLKDLWSGTQEMYKYSAKELAKKSAQRHKMAKRNLLGASEAGTVKKQERMLKQGNKYLSESQELADQAKHYTKLSTSMDCISVASDVYSIAQNIESLQNLKNEHASLQALEGTLLIADSTLAVASIGATVLGVALPGGVIVASVAVGFASAIVNSDAFADWANNLDNDFLDAVDSFFEMLLPWMKTPDGVNCYKPNIYFYTDLDKQVTVRFVYPQLVTVSIPDYASGWDVLLTEDDVLITEDGEKFSFLFYESITSKSLFQTEAGYEIAAESREELFAQILSEMGFNEAEIADFIEFWGERLEEGVDYIMYPQDTETVDLAMPVIVDPSPKTIERIWFVFEEDEGQSVEEPEEITVERDDKYALVEWGGMIFE